MRCTVGPKKIAKYRAITGLPIISALVRGGTDHRIDLLIDGGSIVHWYKDGTMEESEITWRDPKKGKHDRH